MNTQILALIFTSMIMASVPAMAQSTFKIGSTAFSPGKTIPDKYTCKGENVSPPLSFSDVPKMTKSIALIVEDPDAPSGVHTHWVAYNIPADHQELKAGATEKFLQGQDQSGKNGYSGPCPPQGNGPHRYYFRAYALDIMLDKPAGASKEEILNAMKGHILQQAELMGTYEIR